MKIEESTAVPPEHPGLYLQKVLAEKCLKPSVFARDLKLYADVITGIIRGKRNISAARAIELEQSLGIPAREWLIRQMDYDLFIAREKLNA